MVMTIAFIVGIMLSPRSFILSGNLVGHLGSPFLGLILLGMLSHLLTVLTYREMFGPPPSIHREVDYLKECFGSAIALSLILGPRILFTLTASVSLLAIAGYVFNEVFLYWFPNLGFSFLLLGSLLIFNCFGRKSIGKIQVFLVALSLLGLFSLILSGLLIDGGPLPEQSSHPPTGGEFLVMGGTSLLLFIGFDLAFSFHRLYGKTQGPPIQSMVFGLVIVGVVFICWGWVSMKFVPLDRLSETTVPHMVTARALLGQSGRIIMGIVFLTASASSVNGLLVGTSNLITEIANWNRIPRFFKRSFDQLDLPLVLLVIGIAGLLYLGMAGEPVLEWFVRAGVCLWLLYYVALHLAILLRRKSDPLDQYRGKSKIFPFIPVLGITIFLVAFFLLGGYLKYIK
jgi:amino acid transporter